MTRRDLYAPIHKAMRNDLFEVSTLAARTDFDNQDSGAAFTARFDGLLAALRHHEEHEDDLVHPLLSTADTDLLDHVEAEHERLSRELEDVVTALGAVVDTETGHRFYLTLNRFVAAYLLHIDHEERALMPAIWAAHGDDVLASVARQDIAAPVAALQAAAPGLLALMNTTERVAILRDIEELLEPDDYATVLAAVLDHLDETAATRLRHAMTRQTAHRNT